MAERLNCGGKAAAKHLATTPRVSLKLSQAAVARDGPEKEPSGRRGGHRPATDDGHDRAVRDRGAWW